MIDKLINDRAGLFRPGWIARVSVYGLEGRNCKRGGEGSLVVLLLAERAR